MCGLGWQGVSICQCVIASVCEYIKRVHAAHWRQQKEVKMNRGKCWPCVFLCLRMNVTWLSAFDDLCVLPL